MQGLIRQLAHTVDLPIAYTWSLGDEQQSVNAWMGQRVRIRFLGEKRCIVCNRRVNKLYQNGYCFPCVTSLAETDLCIVKPHECHHAQGTCRDEEFAQSHCMIPHYVYLAVSSQVKVGLTRKHREFTRWVDQGAHRAMLLAELPTRRDAGLLEMEIAEDMPDKTDWRKMVRGETAHDVDLKALATEIRERLAPTHENHFLYDDVVHSFTYPVAADHPIKARSISLDKEEVDAIVVGVRGQYLLLDNGVFQVRKHAGYRVEIEIG